jgi:hypothetical protein
MNNNKSSKVLAQIHFKKLVETSSVEDFKTLKRVVYVEKIKLCKRNHQFLGFSALLPHFWYLEIPTFLIQLEIPVFSFS